MIGMPTSRAAASTRAIGAMMACAFETSTPARFHAPPVPKKPRCISTTMTAVSCGSSSTANGRASTCTLLAAMLSSLAYLDPDRLRSLASEKPSGGSTPGWVSPRSIRCGRGAYHANLQETPAKADSCSRAQAMGQAPESEVFGALLRRYRLAAGLTQEGLAERAGLAPRGLPRLEAGEHKPQRSTLQRLADALGLTPEQRRRLEAASGRLASSRDTPRGAEARRPPHNLPIQLTSFVGREQELAEVVCSLP